MGNLAFMIEATETCVIYLADMSVRTGMTVLLKLRHLSERYLYFSA